MISKIKNIIATGLIVVSLPVWAQHAVILHTNDTHSQIDPADDGMGGVLRRKAFIDSVRLAEPNVILVDAGDVVQGSLYYSIYKGEVERKVMNALGYDIMILGNHEFDSGMEKLAQEWKLLNAELISSNYDFSQTPLAGMFKHYTTRTVDNKKIGFFAINLNPEGMISESVSQGLKCTDGLKAANAMAWYLKNIENADLVVALTHVGYSDPVPPTPSDVEIAQQTENIDIIIGGHSHTRVGPGSNDGNLWKMTNLAGDTVLIAQTGSLGKHIGKIDVDFANKTINQKLLPIDVRYDNRVDPILKHELETYKQGIDSIVNVVLTTLDTDMPQGAPIMRNWLADIVYSVGNSLFETRADFAVINKGGLRHSLQKGSLTKGMIMTLMPFDNKLVLLEITGRELKRALPLMEQRSVNCVSKGFDFKKIDDSKLYKVITIDYLADGGDYMEPFKKAKRLKSSALRLDDAVAGYLKNNKGKPDGGFDTTIRL
ncbi:MAG: bifunctional metallophosphatase/5'-nucleotidase [Muribaculum sp.]|nr:bifunctional metallophosphatase/5'-nucleotidase [Muribaculaceae bacterium]MCM1080854.1 bifunctional metallophosphatase/5'-nucleotidase [Muribaculum sp.]